MRRSVRTSEECAMARGVLNRYLSLEAFVRTRRVGKTRRRSRSAKSTGSDRFTHTDVLIDGHEVEVTEDDVGVVELHEN
jgi:hypothetical protein